MHYSALITGGSDGEARVWKLDIEEQDSESYPVGEPIYSIVASVS